MAAENPQQHVAPVGPLPVPPGQDADSPLGALPATNGGFAAEHSAEHSSPAETHADAVAAFAHDAADTAEIPVAPAPAETSAGPSLVPPPPKTRMSWGRRVEKLVLALFCLEVGGFLLVFPWVPQWSDNYFFAAVEQLQPLFLSPFFRGAISGLGALNLYLAIVESLDLLGSFLDT